MNLSSSLMDVTWKGSILRRWSINTSFKAPLCTRPSHMKHRHFHISFALLVVVVLGISPSCELSVAISSLTCTSSGGFRSFVMMLLSGFTAQMRIVFDWDHGSPMTLTCVVSPPLSIHRSHVLTVFCSGKRKATEATFSRFVMNMLSCLRIVPSKL